MKKDIEKVLEIFSKLADDIELSGIDMPGWSRWNFACSQIAAKIRQAIKKCIIEKDR